MSRVRQLLYTFLLSIVFIVIVQGFSHHTAEASPSTVPSFHFQIGSKNITNGTSYELKTEYNYVYVKAGDGSDPTTVRWTPPSSTSVITMEPTASQNCQRIVRKGPGYADITATVTHGGLDYTVMFTIYVGLEVDLQNTDTQQALTTGKRIMVLNTIGQEKTIAVKYLDSDDIVPVSGGAVSASAIVFSSDNTTVATVDATGKVKAVGAGSATISMATTTLSADGNPLQATLTVVVRPTFEFTYSNSGGSVTCQSAPTDNGSGGVYTGVPSDFDIHPNTTLGDNLVWKVYSVVYSGATPTKTLIPAGTSKKMTYTVNNSGTVSFSNIKTGTYEIYAFAHKDFNEKANAPYAYMKITVPIVMNDLYIVMNVGDTYDILDNSNITDTKLFNQPSGYDTNIARFDYSTYVIKAMKKGTTTITLVYDPDQDLYDYSGVPDVNITVLVIDGISLSTNKATIGVKGKLQLDASVTDSTAAITWSSNNTSVATVVDGLVTGVKAGVATITATQKINGVKKTATCEITVQASVETIVLTPPKSNLGIGEVLNISATITPDGLSNVNLKWKSSNDAVVAISKEYPLSVTVLGKAGGHAVITAINQDNVVVGYCDITVRQPVASISLSETAATVSLTQKILQLRATVYPDNAVNKEVLWSSTDTKKATVDANGLVTFVSPGTVTIMATSADNAKAVAYCNLDIQIPIKSIALDETTKTMYVGESARLTYAVMPANASNNTMTWISTNTAVATVDTAGKVSAKGVGTTVIILKSADGGFSSYCTITVKLVASAVKFDVTKLNMKTGEYYVLKTTLTPKGSTDNDLTWESSDTKVATVDSEGKIVARSAGNCIIMAKTLTGAVAYCNVTVTQGVAGLVLNYADKTIFKGEKFTLEASITPTNASKLDVTWTTSNPKVATISNKGEVTGIVGGVAVITCTTADGGYIATCVVTVKETVTKITLNYETYNLGKGKTVKLVATVSNETATNQKVTWSSSNKKVATVSSTGKVTGLKSGYAVITATALDGSEVEASCEVRVVTLVTSLSLNKTTLAMFVGESKSLKATIKPSKATIKKAKWTSSDTSVAIVDEDGTIIGIKEGSVMVTAEALDSSGKKAICYVTVYKRVASTGITLQDKKVTLVPKETKIVDMVLIPSASTDKVTWSSDNTAVASVNKTTGKIVAKSPGTAYITVMTDSGKTATVEVTVIGLNTNKLTTEEYTTYDQALSVEGASGKITWRSSNPQIVVVKSDGTISTRGIGTAKVTATVNGRKLTCTIVVKKMA